MKSRVLSRGPQINTEKCVELSGTGRFDMVLAAAARAREIRRQHKSSDKYEHTHAVVTALLDIQEGRINTADYFIKVK